MHVRGGGQNIYHHRDDSLSFPRPSTYPGSGLKIRLWLRNTGSHHRELSPAVLHVLGVEGAVLQLLLLAFLLLYTSLLIRSDNI